MDKYILVFKDEEDQTSNHSLDWLTYFNQFYVVLNNDNLFVKDFILNENSLDFILEGTEILLHLSDLKSYWLRRGELKIAGSGLFDDKFKMPYLHTESKTLTSLIMSVIYQKHGIGQMELNETNKIFNLLVASEFGLKIPTVAISSYKSVLTLRLDALKFCTKAIRQGYYTNGQIGFNGPTRLINKKDLDKLEDITWPSLLQEYQKKKYELRIFYLDGDFYTSAIFSQNDEQTKVDFRNYNQARPNRTPPYKLPKEIEKKLHKLMQKLTIKCGSIDMVVNTKNEFVFLEVNPFGQFQQVSFPCNYYLELKVAEYLTKYDKTEEAVC